MTDADNIQTTQHGGLTRITIGATTQPSEATPSAPQESSRVLSGPIRHSMHTGETSQAGVVKYTEGQDSAKTVMATLKRDSRGPSVELEPGNPASRTLLSIAVKEGLVEPVGDGQYRDRPGSGEPAQEASPENPQPTKATEPDLGPAFDPVEANDWVEAIAPLPQHSFDAAAASVTAAVLTGADNLTSAATKLAESAGLPPQLAQSYVEEGFAMYSRLVEGDAKSMNITDTKAYFDWMRDSKGHALQEAMQSLVAQNDISKFRTLALEYGRHTSPQAQALRAGRSL
jgi:hypothetical protein